MNDDLSSRIGVLLVPLISLLLLASLWAWWRAFDRVARGRVLLPYVRRRQPPWGLLDLLLAFFFLVVCVSGTAWILARFFGVAMGVPLPDLPPEAQGTVLLGSALHTLVAFLLSVGIVRLRIGATLADLGIVPAQFWADVRLGCTGFIMLAPVVYGIQMLLVQMVESKHPLVELLRNHPDPKFFIMGIVAAVLVAPLAEEYFFRVLLQGWLERAATAGASIRELLLGGRPDQFGAPHAGGLPAENVLEPDPAAAVAAQGDENPYHSTDSAASSPSAAEADAATPSKPAGGVWVVLIPAVLFSLAHASHGPDPIPLFVLALGLGYMYRQTHRILPCIIVHFLLNSSSLAILWLVVYLGEAPA